jgi:hypothetical protein
MGLLQRNRNGPNWTQRFYFVARKMAVLDTPQATLAWSYLEETVG